MKEKANMVEVKEVSTDLTRGVGSQDSQGISTARGSTELTTTRVIRVREVHHCQDDHSSTTRGQGAGHSDQGYDMVQAGQLDLMAGERRYKPKIIHRFILCRLLVRFSPFFSTLVSPAERPF
ncbi:hypothetical protein RRG08_059315 [Elysia crispata]|uniref:Uncharacterized protein n=1 Tax=Elysia crispata TaxID=231223 RepID=A0AAE0ZDQ1_9GAST|nr:hypothetical protein RRG08_059315 [Elysia crispata]